MNIQNRFALLCILFCCALLVACGDGVANAAESIPVPAVAADPGEASVEEGGPPDAEAAGEDEDETGDIEEARPPIGADRVAEGSYEIEVSSSSSMFRVVHAELTVADGAMSAVLTLSGTGYEKLYMGTGEEALADSDERCIYFVEDDEGMYTYEVPVEALDRETDVAAWSIRKQSWYDRVLVFESDLIPADAILPE